MQAQDLDYTLVRLFRDGQVYQAPLRAIYGDNALRDVLLEDGDAVFVDTDYDLTQARAYFSEQLQLRDLSCGAGIRLPPARGGAGRHPLRHHHRRRAALDLPQPAGAWRGRARLRLCGRRSPGAAPLAPAVRGRLKLADVLFENGGINTNFGDYSQIYVLRRHATPTSNTLGGIDAYHLNASNVANLTTAAMFEMRPNDVVFVAEQPITVWSRIINQLTPSLLSQAATVANVSN